MSKHTLKRIVNKDMKEIQRMNLSDMGIHVKFDESNMLKAKAIIFGPKDTPYENGILYFIIEFPTDYPFNPPKVVLKTLDFFKSCFFVVIFLHHLILAAVASPINAVIATKK